MEDITAASESELISVLRSMDISVPDMTVSEDCERWSICWFLATSAKHNVLSYPLRLHHRDKPDFRLELRDELVGIEVTGLMVEEYVRACAFAKRNYPGVWVEPSQFKRGMKKMTKRKLCDMLSQEKDGPGWYGGQIEREWLQAISDCIQGKTRKLNSSGFEKFPLNYLLIYDNLEYHLMTEREVITALGYLSRDLKSYWTKKNVFDRIFVQIGSEIAVVDAGGFYCWAVNDLWRRGH